MERSEQHAARQQIDPGPFQFAGARTGQHEGSFLFLLDEAVDGAQNVRHLLDLVHDDDLLLRIAARQLDDALGPRDIGPENVGFEQVDPESVGIVMHQEGGLSRTSGAKQEKTLLGSLEKSWNI